MSGAPSTRPYAERLWDRVPVWTRVRDDGADGILRALCGALGVGLDAIQSDVLRLLDDMFVDSCDPRLIPLLADLVGVSVDREGPAARQRHQVKYALHLRRRTGTIEQIETIGWQVTGFRVRVDEARGVRRTVGGPPRSARVSGLPSSDPPAVTLPVSGVGVGHLDVVMDVAWPVRREQAALARVNGNVVAIDPSGDVGLRRADGTPIFLTDDPDPLVGPGLPIELILDGGDFEVLGPLRPRFMNLAGDVPVYVPHHTLAIDPTRGRVAGPTPPAAGLRAHRRYRLRYWAGLGATPIFGTPAHHDDGVFTFADDGSTDGLTDEQGIRLRLAFEGEAALPEPAGDERLLVVREAGWPSTAVSLSRQPLVLLPPGKAFHPARTALDQPGALPLDEAGLARLFTVEDSWGWDLFEKVRLVRSFGSDPPADDTVEVEVEGGRFRLAPIYQDDDLRVRYHRRYDIAALRRRGEAAVLGSVPLGRGARVRFRDTTTGRRALRP